LNSHVGPSVSSPPIELRSNVVVNMQQQSGITIISGTTPSVAQSPTKQIPPPLQLVGSPSPAAPTPTNVVLIRPAPVLSPTSRSAPGGGFFIHTGTSSAAAPAAAVNGPSSVQSGQVASTVVIQTRPVAQSAPDSGGRGPVVVVPQDVRTTFSIVSSAPAQQPSPPAARPATTGAAQDWPVAPARATIEPVEIPHETITTLVKTSEALKTSTADVAVSIIRAPTVSKPERKGPPPPTASELLASADVFWVCGFALAVMAIAFVAMANEEEIPITYILSGVILASLGAFVKLRL
jgi:hypothetical protein